MASTNGSTAAGGPRLAAHGQEYDAAYARRVMLILAALVTLVLYIEGMLTPSLLKIQQEFGVSSGQTTLVLSAYIITGVALSPVVGKLGDIYGKKRMLTIVLLLYAACVSVTGFSPTFGFMVGARAFQGIGLTIFPLGMSLVREEFPRDMVPRAQGILSAMFGAGFAVSLPLGAWVSDTYGWRTTYHTAIPFVVLLAVLVFFVLRESPFRRPDTKVDYVGASLLGLSLALIVLAISEGPTWGWLADSTLVVLLVGAAFLIPLVWYELAYHARGGEPILDFRLLRQRNVMVVNTVGTVAGLGMYLAMLSMVYLLGSPASSGGYGESILGIGLCLVPLAIGMLIFAAVAGVLVSRTGTRVMTAIGSAVTAFAFVLAIGSRPLDQLLAVEFLVGAGIGIVNAGVINLLVLTVAPRDMGLATSLSASFRNIGSSLGAPISGSLIATFVTVIATPVGNQTIPAFEAFQWSFAIAAVCFVFAGAFVAFGREVLGRGARPVTAPVPAATTEASPPAVVPPLPTVPSEVATRRGAE